VLTATGTSEQQVSSNSAMTRTSHPSIFGAVHIQGEPKHKQTLVDEVRSKLEVVKPISVLKDFDPETDSVTDLSEHQFKTQFL